MLEKLFLNKKSVNKPRAMVTPSGSRASRLDFKSLLWYPGAI